MKTIDVLLITSMLTFTFGLTSCKKNVDPHIPPDVTFNSSPGYLSGDAVVGLEDTLTTEMTATKTEDDLKSYNISVAYDGATATTTFFNYAVDASEYGGFTKTVNIITRNTPGSEKWVFSVVDRDGNITQNEFILTVE